VARSPTLAAGIGRFYVERSICLLPHHMQSCQAANSRYALTT
jgi:hypothetical protein